MDCSIIFYAHTNRKKCNWCSRNTVPTNWLRDNETKKERWALRKIYNKMMKLPHHKRIEVRINYDRIK